MAGGFLPCADGSYGFSLLGWLHNNSFFDVAAMVSSCVVSGTEVEWVEWLLLSSLAAVDCPGVYVCRESELLLFAFALSSSPALPSSCGGNCDGRCSVLPVFASCAAVGTHLPR